MFFGQLACEAANFSLKRLIKEERPKGQAAMGKGYGMPSSHAQFAAFWAVYLGLFLMVRHAPRATGSGSGPRPRGLLNGGAGQGEVWQAGAGAGGGHGAAATPLGGFLERFGTSLLAMSIAAAVAWSRVYLNYHTPRQVLAGWCAGVACAIGWFVVTSVARQVGLWDWALEHPSLRLFRIRDLVLTEDPAQAGWEKWETLRVQRVQRKEL
ncbi:uncharacterized protein MKZ38_010571 [Zalerion maritima]|uniref:Dolichyldiphosphatase n=1 Tax=Zalerion maritima TaxID=339359 RepID=A0AAD5RTY1_9PEZI|nr:uncharacterized protein MKZ38_010571 [Zalerion maritima]